jgi:flavin-dependent dehydrogenase
MKSESTQFDVVILGAGLAGSTLALQLRRASPELSVCVLERSVGPYPDATHKVGESTVEIGAHYLADVVGLRAHLEERHIRKFGFRFFSLEGRNDIDAVQEIGTSRYLHVPSYQIDRGVLENFLVEQLLQADVTLRRGCAITDVDLQSRKSGQPHLVWYQCGGVRSSVSADWVVDTTGRSGLLRKKLGLKQANGHGANAVWFRIPVRIDVEDWSDQDGWLGRCEQGQRWRSTNHLVGEGYWVWLIPLSSGFHSVGIVADESRHPFAGMHTYEKALNWLECHQPRLAQAIRDSGALSADFRRLKDFSYGCSRFYSPDRWAVSGEAGAFLDPFYSPGSDFIAISNSFITDLVLRSRSSEPWHPYVTLYDQLFRSFYESTLTLYKGQYGIFGNPEVLALKVIWDYTYYWSILCQLFFQRRLTDLKILSRIRKHLQDAQQINERVQQVLRVWSEQGPVVDQGRFLDQAQLPWFVALNQSLGDRLDEDAFVHRIEQSTRLLSQLAWELVESAMASGVGNLSEISVLIEILPVAHRDDAGLLNYKAA